MSWIQENRFAAGLGGITAVAAVGLIAWGMSASKKYAAAKERYDEAASQVSSMESADLYPNEDNLAGKKKAVEDYDKDVAALQEAFNPFRAPTPPNVEPADFSETLLKAKDVAAAAFEKSGTEIPAEFFLGSEEYTNSPVRKEATGILTYQLEAISQLAANLADAAPAKLLNIHRPKLEEEEGKKFDPQGKTYRALPVEIAFTGTEASFRKFLSSLDDSGKYYYVIRSMRVTNEKTKAPTAADGVFKVDEPEDGGADAADPFGGAGGFVLPGEEPAADETPAEDTPAEGEADAPGAGASDEGEILQQVLGSELIHVFLRIDIIQFLEAPKA